MPELGSAPEAFDAPEMRPLTLRRPEGLRLPFDRSSRGLKASGYRSTVPPEA
jgi:hypothetical protein